MTVSEIFDILNSLAPFDTAMEFDNAGLLVGDPHKEVIKIGIVLDITDNAVEYAIQNDIDLIISHHPVIFNPIKSLLSDSIPYKLAANGICAISAHTNLDAANGGVNDALTDTLGLIDVSPLADPKSPNTPPMARIGQLSHELTSHEFANMVAEILNTTAKTVVCQNTIKTVAVCGGAGDDFIIPAVKNGADALVTADVKHHNLLLAQKIGLCLVDAGHFETENVIVPVLREKIERLSGVETVIIPQKSPVEYF